MEIQYLLQLAQLIVYAIIATVFVMRITSRVEIVKADLKNLDGQLVILNACLGTMGELRTQIAVMQTELSSAKEDIRELRHGRGFVRDAINGEYDTQGKVSKSK